MSAETYIKNKLGAERTSNYEIMSEEARKRFLTMDMQEVSHRTCNPQEDCGFRLFFLGREYIVSAKNGRVAEINGRPVGHDIPMILYDLLGYSKEGSCPSGEYTQVQNLAEVVSAVKYAGQGMFDKQIQHMDGRDRYLAAACEALGGKPWGKGDVSYIIPLYKDLRFVFSFWNSDDEFAASSNVFFDSNSLQYMHYETIWYCLGHIFARIEEEMTEAEKKAK